ncbi:hypothetical protein DRO97_04315, partial [Archaeoglobales archaeon]
MEFVYFYFHEEEIDCVLEELKNKGVNLKPKFKKYKYAELIATNENFVLGKCENIGFLISKDVEIKCDILEKIVVRIVKSDDSFDEFTYGKFKV